MNQITIAPIADAPVKPGEAFGPCLLAPAHDPDLWVIGHWNGDGWFCSDGAEITPRLYALLPIDGKLKELYRQFSGR